MSGIKRRKKTPRPAGASRMRSQGQLAWYLAVPLVLLLCCCAPWQRIVGNFFAPYLLLDEAVEGTLADQSLKLHSRSRLAKEVETLRKQNLILAGENSANKRLQEENRQLRAMLKLSPLPGYSYIAADVILRDPWMWDSGFTINRGSRDGIQPGLAVLAPAPDSSGRVIMLGVIDENIGKYSARVISVINPDFRISVSLPESGAVGFLNAGDFAPPSGGRAAVGSLPANQTFSRNEPLYTTGYEANIPGGLWLGNLESIEQTSLPFGNRLYRRGVMRPAGNYSYLRSVMIARIEKQNQPGKGIQ